MDLDALRQIESLSSSSHAQLVQASRRLVWRRYAPGELILPHQVQARVDGLVYRGKVQIAAVLQGHRQVIGHIAAKGPIPGEFKAHFSSPVELRAVEPTVLCLLPADALQAADSPKARLAETLRLALEKYGGKCHALLERFPKRIRLPAPPLTRPDLARVSAAVRRQLGTFVHTLRTKSAETSDAKPVRAHLKVQVGEPWRRFRAALLSLKNLRWPSMALIAVLFTTLARVVAATIFAFLRRTLKVKWVRAGVLTLSAVVLLALAAWGWQSPLRIPRSKFAYALASHRLDEGQAAKALPLLQSAVDLNPDLAAAHNDMGCIYHQWGQAEQAQAAFQRAVVADPTFAMAQNNLGLRYLEDGQLGLAHEALQLAVTLDPENAASWANLGLVERRVGQPEQAMRAYRAALRLNPQNVAAQANLGLLYYEGEKFSEAQATLEAAVNAQPDLFPAKAILGVIALSEGDHVRAWGELYAAAPALADDPSFHFYLALLYKDAGAWQRAEQELNRVLELGPYPDLAALARSHLAVLNESRPEEKTGPPGE